MQGTQVGFPITGDLIVKNDNALGGVSIKGLVQGNYIKFWNDGTLDINSDSGSNVNIAGIDISGTGAGEKGIEGSFYYGATYNTNSFVQKKYVDDKIGTVTVPTPPTTGNYILKSINGVMTWIAE